ncbi:hypothetical protein MAR_015301 [Mya arenaria]|uniref:Uncharacterized protein n=1 Tax=Mya arenaria TaxID=6604 RepID=A0ABY7FJW1_MYAAR|nr:hypothetical protein MAR_015301 [Mya arenaria]
MRGGEYQTDDVNDQLSDGVEERRAVSTEVKAYKPKAECKERNMMPKERKNVKPKSPKNGKRGRKRKNIEEETKYVDDPKKGESIKGIGKDYTSESCDVEEKLVKYKPDHSKKGLKAIQIKDFISPVRDTHDQSSANIVEKREEKIFKETREVVSSERKKSYMENTDSCQFSKATSKESDGDLSDNSIKSAITEQTDTSNAEKGIVHELYERDEQENSYFSGSDSGIGSTDVTSGKAQIDMPQVIMISQCENLKDAQKCDDENNVTAERGAEPMGLGIVGIKEDRKILYSEKVPADTNEHLTSDKVKGSVNKPVWRVKSHSKVVTKSEKKETIIEKEDSKIKFVSLLKETENLDKSEKKTSTDNGWNFEPEHSEIAHDDKELMMQRANNEQKITESSPRDKKEPVTITDKNQCCARDKMKEKERVLTEFEKALQIEHDLTQRKSLKPFKSEKRQPSKESKDEYRKRSLSRDGRSSYMDGKGKQDDHHEGIKGIDIVKKNSELYEGDGTPEEKKMKMSQSSVSSSRLAQTIIKKHETENKKQVICEDGLPDFSKMTFPLQPLPGMCSNVEDIIENEIKSFEGVSSGVKVAQQVETARKSVELVATEIKSLEEFPRSPQLTNMTASEESGVGAAKLGIGMNIKAPLALLGSSLDESGLDYNDSSLISETSSKNGYQDVSTNVGVVGSMDPSTQHSSGNHETLTRSTLDEHNSARANLECTFKPICANTNMDTNEKADQSVLKNGQEERNSASNCVQSEATSRDDPVVGEAQNEANQTLSKEVHTDSVAMSNSALGELPSETVHTSSTEVQYDENNDEEGDVFQYSDISDADDEHSRSGRRDETSKNATTKSTPVHSRKKASVKCSPPQKSLQEACSPKVRPTLKRSLSAPDSPASGGVNFGVTRVVSGLNKGATEVYSHQAVTMLHSHMVYQDVISTDDLSALFLHCSHRNHHHHCCKLLPLLVEKQCAVFQNLMAMFAAQEVDTRRFVYARSLNLPGTRQSPYMLIATKLDTPGRSFTPTDFLNVSTPSPGQFENQPGESGTGTQDGKGKSDGNEDRSFKAHAGEVLDWGKMACIYIDQCQHSSPMDSRLLHEFQKAFLRSSLSVIETAIKDYPSEARAEIVSQFTSLLQQLCACSLLQEAFHVLKTATSLMFQAGSEMVHSDEFVTLKEVQQLLGRPDHVTPPLTSELDGEQLLVEPRSLEEHLRALHDACDVDVNISEQKVAIHKQLDIQNIPMSPEVHLPSGGLSSPQAQDTHFPNEGSNTSSILFSDCGSHLVNVSSSGEEQDLFSLTPMSTDCAVQPVAMNTDEVHAVATNTNELYTVAVDTNGVHSVATKTNWVNTVATDTDELNTVAMDTDGAHTVAMDIDCIHTVSRDTDEVHTVASDSHRVCTVAMDTDKTQGFSSIIPEVCDNKDEGDQVLQPSNCERTFATTKNLNDNVSTLPGLEINGEHTCFSGQECLQHVVSSQNHQEPWQEKVIYANMAHDISKGMKTATHGVKSDAMFASSYSPATCLPSLTDTVPNVHSLDTSDHDRSISIASSDVDPSSPAISGEGMLLSPLSRPSSCSTDLDDEEDVDVRDKPPALVKMEEFVTLLLRFSIHGVRPNHNTSLYIKTQKQKSEN